MSEPEDHWLEQALFDEGLGFWRLDVSTGAFTYRGALWPTLGERLSSHATLADFGVMVHDDDRASVFDSLSALVEGRNEQQRVTFRVRPGGGATRWLESRSRASVRDATGRAKVVVGSLQDCTELIEARRPPASPEALQTKLRETQARFYSFLASTRDAVWCFECLPPIPLTLPIAEQFERLLEARLVDCNLVYARAHGAADVEAVIGQTLKALNPARIEMLRDGFIKMAGEGYVLAETRSQEGAQVMLFRAQAVQEKNALVRLWGSSSDITERANADRDREVLEAQLRQAQKMESIGTMAGGMAHDFNNVLAAVLAEVDLGVHAINGGDLGEVRESLTLIKRSAARGATLTRRLLNFTRRQNRPRRAMRVDLLVHELWPMLRRLISEAISLKLETAEPLWAVLDPAQLEQVIVTLVANARDAVGERGEIRLRCSPAEIGPNAVRARPWLKPGAFVQLTVSDTGPGIDPSLYDRIFEPFFTTKPPGEGTGLGLSMVYSILKQHDGFVEVRSGREGGAHFDAYLPRVAESVNEPLVLRTPIPSAPANERVLLVEDEPELRESARRILVSGGYRVVTASDGVEAAEVLAREGPFGVLVLDVVMPRKSGPAFFESLPEPRPPVLFTSGYNDESLDGPLFNGPGRGFVSKPYGREGLLWALRSVLDSRE